LRGDEIFVRNPGLEDGGLFCSEAVFPDAIFPDEESVALYGGAAFEGPVDGYADLGVGGKAFDYDVHRGELQSLGVGEELVLEVPLMFGIEDPGRSVEVCVGVGPVFAVDGLVVVLGRLGDLGLGGGWGAARGLGDWGGGFGGGGAGSWGLGAVATSCRSPMAQV
jgi:hypothetical protein